jgi:hypothetical protein
MQPEYFIPPTGEGVEYYEEQMEQFYSGNGIRCHTSSKRPISMRISWVSYHIFRILSNHVSKFSNILPGIRDPENPQQI